MMNSCNIARRDAVLASKRDKFFAIGGALANNPDSLFSENRIVTLRSLPSSAPSVAILTVFKGRADAKMRDVAAWRVVAGVEQDCSLWNRPPSRLPCRPMSTLSPSRILERTVAASRESVPRPFNTTIRATGSFRLQDATDAAKPTPIIQRSKALSAVPAGPLTQYGRASGHEAIINKGPCHVN